MVSPNSRFITRRVDILQCVDGQLAGTHPVRVEESWYPESMYPRVSKHTVIVGLWVPSPRHYDTHRSPACHTDLVLICDTDFSILSMNRNVRIGRPPCFLSCKKRMIGGTEV